MEPSFIRSDGIYLTSLGLVTEAKDWATLQAIKNTTPFKRTAFLTSTFNNALRAHDDSAALRFLELVLRSETDSILEPILKSDTGAGEFAYTVRGGEARGATIALARTRRASVAVELYAQVNRMTGSSPNMTQTRSALMKEVAVWCFETPDEEESRNLFVSFLRLPGLMREDTHLWQEHKKLSLNALHEATGWGVAPNRIKDRILDLVGPSNYRRSDFDIDEAGQILAAAWTRNVVRGWNSSGNPYDTGRKGIAWFASGLRMTSPLAFVSDEMLNLITETAAIGAEIDREVRALLASLEEAPASSPNAPPWEKPNTSLEYVGNDMHSIRITLSYRGYTRNEGLTQVVIVSPMNCDRLTKVNESWFHDQYSIEKSRIFAWCSRQNRSFAVSLNLYLYDEHVAEGDKDTAAEILFRREDTFF